MKFCAKCGSQNADAAQVCQACGTPFGVPFTPGQNQQMYAQGYGAPVNVGVIQNVKKILASPLAMVAIILFTLQTVLTIFAPSTLENFIRAIAYMNGRSMAMYGDMARYLNSGTVSKIIGAIPALIVILGMWLAFAAASNKRSGPMSTAGLTLLKVMTIIYLVFVCIGVAIAEIVMIVVLVETEETLFLIPMLIIAAVSVLMILYYVMAVKTENVIKKAVSTGQVTKPVSAYLAVMLILGGIYTLISFVIWNLLPGGMDILNLLTTLCSAGASVTFGVFLFSYRGKVHAGMSVSGGTNAAPMHNSQNYSVPQQRPQPQQQRPQPTPNGFVPPAPPAQSKQNFGETTVLSNNVVTCAGCGTQFSAQEAKCPSCGRQR